MKSAYELAMERLGQSDPETIKPLSAEQKKQLEEIDRRFQAKFAEREVFLQEQLMKAESAGQHDEASMIRRQIIDEKSTIDEEKEAEKEKIRQA